MPNHYDQVSDFVEFSKGEIDVFWETFQDFDTDKSGAISASELENAFRMMGQGSSPEEIQAIIEEVDLDGSGEIEWPEFLLVMRSFYPNKLRELQLDWYEPALQFPEFSMEEVKVFIQTFRNFDEDESGSIDARELDLVLKSMGQGASKAEIDRLIKILDTDQSGDLQWPEFLGLMRHLYPTKRSEWEREYLEPAFAEFPEFSRQDIDIFYQTFREFDLDGSNSIDVHELDTAFRNMGFGVTGAQLQAVVDEVDVDGSGEIEWIEFLEIMRKFYPFKTDDFIEEFLEPGKAFNEFSESDILAFAQVFRRFDLDGSNSIDSRELALVFKTMGQGCDEKTVKQILQEEDADNSGEIEWTEFLTIMRNVYAGKYQGGAKGAPAPSQAKAAPAAQTQTKAAPAPAQTQTKAAPAPAPAPAQTQTKAAPAPAPAAQTQNKAAPAPVSAKPAPAAAPAKSTPAQSAAAPSSPSQSKNPCARCGKTVYPIEVVKAADLVWHKGCFKCQEEGCELTLNLKTFKASGGKVYCTKHVPKQAPTSITDSILTKSATNAPKAQKAQGIQKDARMSFAPGKAPVVNP